MFHFLGQKLVNKLEHIQHFFKLASYFLKVIRKNELTNEKLEKFPF